MSVIPQRPTATREIILAAAEAMSEILDGADADTIADSYSPGMDGYELTLELHRRCGWDITRAEMEDLDEMDRLVEVAVKEAELKWMAEHNIQPPFPIGTRVRCLSRNEFGVITGIYKHSPACFEIKPDGQDDELTGKSRWICKFEKVAAE